jgi:hypothetical protein
LDRTELAVALVELSRPIELIAAELQRFPWDSEAELVSLTRQHIQSVLKRYAADQLTAKAVEDWANAIEGRDDIGIGADPTLRQTIFELANPSLSQPLDRDRAQQLLKAL